MIPFLLRIDVSALRAINLEWQHAWLDFLMPILSAKWPWVVTTAAVGGLVVFWWRGGRERDLVWVCVFTLIVADRVGFMIKEAVGRPRPCHVLALHLLTGCGGAPSLPSNHVINVAAQAGAIGTRFPRLALPLGLATVAEAYSRVYVGAHYPSDVLVAALIGAGIGWAAATAFGLGPGDSPRP